MVFFLNPITESLLNQEAIVFIHSFINSVNVPGLHCLNAKCLSWHGDMDTLRLYSCGRTKAVSSQSVSRQLDNQLGGCFIYSRTLLSDNNIWTVEVEVTTTLRTNMITASPSDSSRVGARGGAGG